ncbi:MAG: malto-oligosyltrehalose trehalohydrolase [Betaproteobacteria bacterium]|nr:malto-oligosyltrehalose trehalohydrolase [Betaproteobacteria bacterium]
MPFGAELREDGNTRFRLWAPGARTVELKLGLGASPRLLPMQASTDGWFEVISPHARAGTRYAFRIDEKASVPDPASRYNPDDIHAPSMVVDPRAFDWPDAGWRGRPWHEAVIYELHIGTFTGTGDFAGVESRLDYLVNLGVTALELMPVADFPGKRNWGYDGVLPFAPDASYGTPDQLKRLIAAAHARGLMVIMDVVYNHFGPDGNYLHVYAPQFFNPELHTPWGAALNFDAEHGEKVRSFFLHNALYWIEEFHLDGLRLDAVHAIIDRSKPGFIAELGAAVRRGPGARRQVHLILENDKNEAHHLERGIDSLPLRATGQWNDDLHHAVHVLTTKERDGYYIDYAERPLWFLGRSLAEGFGFQGEASTTRDGELRGEPSGHLPASAFISFLQTHDQVGNRALGERIGMLSPPAPLRAMTAALLLSPHIPMLFMGEEFNASSPFLFFCDFHDELADAVREGRRAEFGRFEKFRDPAVREAIPDPNALRTFERSRLVWSETGEPGHKDWLELYRELLQLRATHLMPRLAGVLGNAAFDVTAEDGLRVSWGFHDGAKLHLVGNFSDAAIDGLVRPAGRVIYASHAEEQGGHAPPWSVVWLLEERA